MRQAQCVGCAQRGVMFSSVLHVLPTRYTRVGSHLKRGIWHGAGKAWAWGHRVFPQQVSHDTAQCVAVSPLTGMHSLSAGQASLQPIATGSLLGVG